MKVTKKSFMKYMIITFVISWIIEAIAIRFASMGDLTKFRFMLVILMYVPFISTLISGISPKGMGWLPAIKGKVRYIFIALWLCSALMVVGAGLFFVVFRGAFDGGLDLYTRDLQASLPEGITVDEALASQGLTIRTLFLAQILQGLTIAPLINMFIALGEEVGWRGVMYPYLKDKYGLVRGRIAGGIIWGIWHWPIMIFAGYEYGSEYLGSPVLGPVVFCIFTTTIGILMDYVYDRTGCIWIPSLMHGSVNAFSTVFPYLLAGKYARYIILGPVPYGLISMIPLIIAAVLIMRIGNKNR